LGLVIHLQSLLRLVELLECFKVF